MARKPSNDSTDRYAAAFEQSPVPQLFVDVASHWIVEANPAAARLYGRGQDQLRQLRLGDLLIGQDEERQALVGAMLEGRPRRTLTRQRVHGGEIRELEIESAPIAEPGSGEYLHLVVHDVSDREHAALQLRVYRDFYDSLPVPLYRATRGATGRFVRFNPAFLRLFEADDPEQLFGCSISDLYVDPRQRERFSNELMQHGEVSRYELQLRTLTGRVIHCVDTAYQHEDEHGRVVFDGVLEDVTRQRELEQELAYQARYDELTGLANRRHCDRLLATEIERSERYGQPLSLLMLDLDHFKRVNDESGHAAGDLLLQRVAGCIGYHVRQTDTAARWGGEEFMVMLPSTRERGARHLAEKLRTAVARVSNDSGQAVTASVGFGEYENGEGWDAFLARIDRALYAAKDAGRDRVELAPRPRSRPARRKADSR